MADPTTAPPWPRPAAAWYAVGVLLLAYTAAYIDRAILTILAEPIQRDLHINDTELGLLHGFAFVIFYVTLGVPLGVLADRTNRKRLVFGSILVWSVMTASCGLANTFGKLFAARVGVGIGEAGLSPAAYSLISDYFPPQQRSIALGVYTLGIYLGAGMALLTGGLVVDLVGHQPFVQVPMLGTMRAWQVVFLIVGLPGLLIAAVVTTVREPARRLQRGDAHAGGDVGDATWRHLTAHWRAYTPVIVGFSFLGVPFNVALLWARPYLTRHFGTSPPTAATIIGVLMLVFAASGILTGSWLSDRLQAHGHEDASLRVGLGSALLLLPPIALFPFMPTLASAVAALAVLLFFGAFAYGAAASSLQLITPNRMRAAVSATYLVVVNLVGLTAGPVITGALTDYVFRNPGAVGMAAAVVGGCSSCIAAGAFRLGQKPFRILARAQAMPASAV